MADGTKIEWAHATWNPVVGCDKVSPGCTNCYATNMARRLELMGQEKYTGLTVLQGSHVQWTGKVSFDEGALLKPLAWKKPKRIFVTSMGDPNHANVTDEMRDRMLAVIALTPQHDYLWLTKRPGGLAAYLSDPQLPQRVIRELAYLVGYLSSEECEFSAQEVVRVLVPIVSDAATGDDAISITIKNPSYPLPNLWVGTSVENAEQKHRIDELRAVPAAVRFLSCEPLLGDLGSVDLTGIHWVIAGGESGAKARPMHPDWVWSLRDQCKAAGVPFFFKQWGEWKPICEMAGGEHDALYVPRKKARKGEEWRQDDLNAAYGKRCMVELCCLGFKGETDQRHAFRVVDGHSGMTFFRVGKKAAGHLLDGVEHHAFPITPNDYRKANPAMERVVVSPKW